MKKIIVYSSTMEKAFNKLQDLLDNMNQEDIKQVKKSSAQTGIFSIGLKNGDYYVAVKAGDGAKGHRWQYAYIDKEINEDILHNVILCKFIPENITDYFCNSNRNEEDYYEFY